MSQWFESDVQANGINIHYARAGQAGGPVLLLAHGFSDNGACWGRVVENLKNDFDVIMLDARNHGESSRGVATAETQVDDLAGAIKALNLDRPIVLGHSMGASSVAGLAAYEPSLVSKIILEDPPWRANIQSSKNDKDKLEEATRQREGFQKFLQALTDKSEQEIIAEGKKTHPRWHDDDFPAWAKSKKLVGEDAMTGLSWANWREIVTKIQCPSLLVYADADGDGIVKQSAVDEVLEANKNFEAVQILGAGHNIRREQFTEYMKAIRSFLFSD